MRLAMTDCKASKPTKTDIHIVVNVVEVFHEIE